MAALARAPRPTPLRPRLDAVPEPLRRTRSWVAWRYELRNGRWTKPPLQLNGRPAKSNDSTTWCSFEAAAAVAETFDGTGIVLVDDLVGVDLDHVLDPETGEMEGWASEVLERFRGCYAERSPSGNGIRIFCRGAVARSGKGGPGNRLELYGRGSPRYLTVTGHTLGEGGVIEAQAGLDWLQQTYLQKGAPKAPEAPTGASAGMGDDEILRRAREARNGTKFTRLWAGDAGDDASSADAALLGVLAFWTRDPAQLDRLFRRSGLMREKWDSRRGDTTYGAMTIERVLGMGGEHYKPRGDSTSESETSSHREQQRREAQAIGDGIADALPLADQMTLADMLAQLVFISDGSRVARRDKPHITLALPEFKLHTAASLTRVGKRMAPTSDLWVQSPARITAHTVTFRPDTGAFTTDPEGADALNLWKPRQRPQSTASVETFLDHLAYLVPTPEERERFIDWLAHAEQKPGELPHTHYLMVTSQTGIGRNWLASVLARVWAGATRLGFDLVGAMNSGFNGPLSRRLLVVVDELKAADTSYGVANYAQQLKAMLTTEHRTINPKFGRMHIEFNCARWLMFSQHYDALPLERADRRVIVVSNPTERMPVEYYRRLYAMVKDADFINAVGAYLAQRDISNFNPSEPAPLTESKQKAIEACVSDVERALIDLRNGTSDALMTAAAVAEYLSDCGLTRPSPRAMGAAYAGAGIVPCKALITVFGKKHRVVALRDGEDYKNAPAAELQRLIRGGGAS